MGQQERLHIEHLDRRPERRRVADRHEPPDQRVRRVEAELRGGRRRRLRLRQVPEHARPQRIRRLLRLLQRPQEPALDAVRVERDHLRRPEPLQVGRALEWAKFLVGDPEEVMGGLFLRVVEVAEILRQLGRVHRVDGDVRVQLGILLEQAECVDIPRVDDSDSLRRRDVGDLAELVEIRDEPDDLVSFEELRQGHPTLGRLEREPLDEHLEALVVLHRQGLDRQAVDRQEVAEGLGPLLREPHEVVTELAPEGLARLIHSPILVERLARGGRAEVIRIDDRLHEEGPFRQQVIGRLRQ